MKHGAPAASDSAPHEEHHSAVGMFMRSHTFKVHMETVKETRSSIRRSSRTSDGEPSNSTAEAPSHTRAGAPNHTTENGDGNPCSSVRVSPHERGTRVGFMLDSEHAPAGTQHADAPSRDAPTLVTSFPPAGAHPAGAHPAAALAFAPAPQSALAPLVSPPASPPAGPVSASAAAADETAANIIRSTRAPKVGSRPSSASANRDVNGADTHSPMAEPTVAQQPNGSDSNSHPVAPMVAPMVALDAVPTWDEESARSQDTAVTDAAHAEASGGHHSITPPHGHHHHHHHLSRQMTGKIMEGIAVEQTMEKLKSIEAKGLGEDVPPPVVVTTTSGPEGSEDEYVSRLIFFENLFFRLDVDGSGTIAFDEMRRMFSFTAVAMTMKQVDDALLSADVEQSDGELNRYEFMDMCISYMWHIPLEQLELAATNYAEFRLARGRRLNAKWRRRANRIDGYSRFFFPFFYCIFGIVIFNIRLEDDYVGRDEKGEFAEMSSLCMPFSTSPCRMSPVHNAIQLVGFIFLFALLMLVFVKGVLIPARRRRRFETLRAGPSTQRSKAKRDAKLAAALSRKEAEVARQASKLADGVKREGRNFGKALSAKSTLGFGTLMSRGRSPAAAVANAPAASPASAEPSSQGLRSRLGFGTLMSRGRSAPSGSQYVVAPSLAVAPSPAPAPSPS